jgi:predicted GNAT family acetyltransferase
MPDQDNTDIEVVDHPEARRYEARAADGTVLGFSQYRVEGETVVFTHTEVDDAQEGQGVGSRLVRGALDDVRAGGRRIRPLCPFVKAYVDQHPEYADLVEDRADTPG